MLLPVTTSSSLPSLSTEMLVTNSLLRTTLAVSCWFNWIFSFWIWLATWPALKGRLPWVPTFESGHALLLSLFGSDHTLLESLESGQTGPGTAESEMRRVLTVELPPTSKLPELRSTSSFAGSVLLLLDEGWEAYPELVEDV